MRGRIMHISGQLLPTVRQLNGWPRFRLRLFAEGACVGILSGSAAGFFRWALEKGTVGREYVYSLLTQANLLWNCLWFLVLALAGYILYKCVAYEPDAAGSGIPQVKGAISCSLHMRWFRVFWVKLFSGILGIGLGLSLGREGPSIQLGAVTAQGFSEALKRTRMEERYLITAGASAGLAMAFNAPLAGVLFALEELHRNFSGVVLAPAMAAALIATVICRLMFGAQSVFQFGVLSAFPVTYTWLAVLLGVVLGFCGLIFNKGLLLSSRFYRLPIFTKSWMPVVFALFTAGILGYVFPQILGGGNELINSLHTLPLSLKLFAALLVGKFVFTLVSYGCGVPGGFFLPILVIGALLGSVIGICLIDAGLVEEQYLSDIVVIAMAAFFTAAVHSPITGTVLIMEMTGSYEHLLVLCTAALIALVTAKLCGGRPVYDMLLERLLQKGRDGAADKKRNIIELTVGSGCLLDGKSTREIPWPEHVALIDVKRGDGEIIPDTNTVLAAGDYIYILTDDAAAAEAVRHMTEEENV